MDVQYRRERSLKGRDDGPAGMRGEKERLGRDTPKPSLKQRRRNGRNGSAGRAHVLPFLCLSFPRSALQHHPRHPAKPLDSASMTCTVSLPFSPRHFLEIKYAGSPMPITPHPSPLFLLPILHRPRGGAASRGLFPRVRRPKLASALVMVTSPSEALRKSHQPSRHEPVVVGMGSG